MHDLRQSCPQAVRVNIAKYKRIILATETADLRTESTFQGRGRKEESEVSAGPSHGEPSLAKPLRFSRASSRPDEAEGHRHRRHEAGGYLVLLGPHSAVGSVRCSGALSPPFCLRAARRNTRYAARCARLRLRAPAGASALPTSPLPALPRGPPDLQRPLMLYDQARTEGKGDVREHD